MASNPQLLPEPPVVMLILPREEKFIVVKRIDII